MKTFTSTVCFAGAGLYDCGIETVGGKVIQAIEYDSTIARIYCANFPNVRLHVKPIEKVSLSDLEVTDHVHGSPPCTRASIANKNGKETSEDIESAQAFLAIIKSMYERSGGEQPKWVTLEQVEGYKNFVSFGIILGGLQALGYATGWQVLNAANFGVPQNRRRLILRASLPAFAPSFTQLGLFSAGELQPITSPNIKVSWYEAIKHMIPHLPPTNLANWQIKQLIEKGVIDLKSNLPLRTSLLDSRNSQNSGNGLTIKALGDSFFTLTTYSCDGHTPKVLISGNGSNNFGGGMSVKWEHQQSFTLCSSDSKRASKVVNLESGDVRLLTPEAGWLLQMYGCEKQIIWSEEINNLYKWKTIANGVPYRLSLAVMKSLVGEQV